MDAGLFGSRLRTDVLVLTGALGETYGAELARLLGKPLYSVQRAIESLERADLIASRRRGSVRLVSLQPRYFAFKELYELVLRASADPRYQKILSSVRRRPRAIGKQL